MPATHSEKAWILAWDPRAANGDFLNSFPVGGNWDLYNLRESVKAGVLYEGMVFRHKVTGEVQIVVRSHKNGKLALHEINFRRDWISE